MNTYIKEEITSTITDNNSNNENIRQTFIFSIHNYDNATLIDISNLRNNSFNLLGVPEQIKLNLKFSFKLGKFLLLNSQNSMVTVNDSIYILNPYNDNSQFCKFSIGTKSFEHPVKMNGLSSGIRLTACFDGQDHIYFYNYIQSFFQPGMLKIERFNLRTQTTELCHCMPRKQNELYIQVISFFHNGILYSLGGMREIHKLTSPCSLSVFNPQSKTFDTYTIKELKRETNSLLRFFCPIPRLACTDNRGNIYIYHEMSRFVRFNVETKELVELSTISFDRSLPLRIGITLVYHEVSENESYIFFMGGRDLSNFVYSTISKTWSKFYETDECNRLRFGSAIVSFNFNT